MLASPQSSFGRVVEHSCGACRHHTPFRRRDIQEGLQNGQGCSLFSEDEPGSSPPGSHPWPSCLTRAYSTLPTSLFFSSPNAIYWRMSHCPAAKPRVATGLRERGLLSTEQVQCGKNGEFDGVYFAWLYLFIYIVVALYSYMFIYLYRYFAIFLLLNCMLKAWEYCFLYIYCTYQVFYLQERSFLQAPYYNWNNCCCGIPIFH